MTFHIFPHISSYFPHFSILVVSSENFGNFYKFRFLGGEEGSKLSILGSGVEIIGHFPEYDVIRGMGEGFESSEICIGADREQSKDIEYAEVLRDMKQFLTSMVGSFLKSLISLYSHSPFFFQILIFTHNRCQWRRLYTVC